MLSTDYDFSPSPVSFSISRSQQFSSGSTEKTIECIEPTTTSLNSLLDMIISTFPTNCALAWLNTNSTKTGSTFNSKEFGCIACKPGYRAIRLSGNDSFLIGKIYFLIQFSYLKIPVKKFKIVKIKKMKDGLILVQNAV